MTQIKSRLIELTSKSSLTSTHALVSLPEKAWGWLDTLVTDKHLRAGYEGLIKAAAANGCTKTLTKDLRRKAQESYEKQMDRLYDLANDNCPKEGYGDLKRNPSMPEAPEFILEVPSVIRLFHFVPHATYLTTVYERKHLCYLPSA